MADTKTLEQIKAELDAWIAKYIGQTVNFRTGQTLSVERFNELFNLLITQGDDNINTMEIIIEYLNLMVTDYTYLIDELTTNLNQTYAAIQADNTAIRSELASTFAQMQANNVTLKNEITTQVNNLRDTLTITYAQMEADNEALLADVTAQIQTMNSTLTATYAQIQADNATLLATLRAEIEAIDDKVDNYQAAVLAQVQVKINELNDTVEYVEQIVQASESVIVEASQIFQRLDDITTRVGNLEIRMNGVSATEYSLTLAAASWVGSAAPYTYALPYGSEYDVELLTSASTTQEQVKALEKAKIISNATANTVIAWGTKPTIDIPVTAKVKLKFV